MGRRLLALVRACDTAVRSFGTDLVEVRANALTYRTLLSLVPFLAVVFSLFQAFGGLEASRAALQDQILQNLAPGAAAQVVDHLFEFMGRVSSGAVSGVGVVLLLLTVVSLLTSIEEFFNALWHVEKVRPFLARFVTYWAMMTVGPVLLALSLSMTSVVRSDAFVSTLDRWVPGGTWVVTLPFQLLPWMFTWTAMTLLYVIVPNTGVRWLAAIPGGILAGSLWELAKLAFTWASSNLFRYDAIYGSFAALMVLLVWLQLGWTIILLGCKVTYALQHERALVEERVAQSVGPAGREFLAVRCMVEVARAFLSGGPRPTAEQLAAGAGALEIEKEVLNRLVAASLLVEVSETPDDSANRPREDEADARYVPARDPGTITVEDVLNAFRLEKAGPLDLGGEDAASACVRAVLRHADEAAESVVGTLSLTELVRRAAEGSDAPPVEREPMGIGRSSVRRG
jgi:membrane protein